MVKNKGNEKVWKVFDKYWDATNWEDVSRKKVAKILGDAIDFDIPKGLTDPKIGKPFYDEVKDAIKPPRKAGGSSYSFKGVEASAEDIFGKKPVPMPQLMSKLWEFINDEENGVVKAGAKKPKVEVDEDEDEE